MSNDAVRQNAIFIIDLMMKQKTGHRVGEINRRFNELKAAGSLMPELIKAHAVWAKVPMGEAPSKDAPPASAADAATPAKTKAKRKPKAGKEPAAAAKPTQGPTIVLKGTTHPEGEPRYSPFAALASRLQGESVPA
jgi:cell wall-associated NlpC family hydrolase